MQNEWVPFKMIEEAWEKGSFIWKMHNQEDLDSWMLDYLKEEGIQDHLYDAQGKVSLVFQALHPQLPLSSQLDQLVQVLPHAKTRKTSIFHNFQKNLLSLLKRTVSIKKIELMSFPYGDTAYELWKLLLNQQNQSKKALYLTFGVSPKENGKYLRKICLESPCIQKLMQKYGLQSIEQSQRFLRERVYHKASMLEREEIQKICKVKDFPSFYRYFLIFVDELSQGPMSQRMTKDQRYRHLHSEE